MNTATHANRNPMRMPTIRHVSIVTPFKWLRLGWDDMLHHPAASLAYGALITVLGALILGYPSHPYTIAAAMTGFMLVGPIMAAGLCELSRQRSYGHPVKFEASLRILKSHRGPLFRYALLLLAFSVAWFGASSFILYQYFGSVGPNLTNNIWGDALSLLSGGQIASYIAVGGLLAAAVFLMSVITVPLILDRDMRVRTAVMSSVKTALSADVPAMIVWGALCTLLVIFGFASYLIGMIVVFPLLGHATWYAYLDLVEKERE